MTTETVNDIVTVEVIRHCVGSDGTMNWRATFNVAFDPVKLGKLADRPNVEDLLIAAIKAALADKRSKFPAFGTSRDDGMPLYSPLKKCSNCNTEGGHAEWCIVPKLVAHESNKLQRSPPGHGGGMAGHDDDIEPLTDEELDNLDTNASVGDFGAAGGDIVQRATEEIRWLRTKLRSLEAELALSTSHCHE